MKISLGIQTSEVPVNLPVTLLSGTFEEKLLKASALGVEAVELYTIRPWELDAASVKASLQQNELSVSAVSSGGIAFATGITLLNADAGKASHAQKILRNLIDFAGAINAPIVTIGSFRGRAASVNSGGRQKLMDLLHLAAEYAKTLSVRLVIEPLNRYETDLILNTAEALEFIRQINHPNIGLLLDTFHVNIEEASWTEPFSRALAAGLLWHIHAADNNRLPPGHGLINFRTLITILREGNYSGYLSGELLPRPTPDEAARQTVDYLRRLIAPLDLTAG